MLKRTFYIVLISTILSCNNDKEIKIVTGDLKDFKADEFTLILDEFSNGMSQVFQYSQIVDSEYLMMVETGGIGSSSGPNIDLYNVNKGEKIKRLHVPREGPNGVPMPPKVWMINLDSLLLVTSGKMYYMNWEGEIINQVELGGFIENARDKMPEISNYSPPIFVGDQIFIGLIPGLENSQLWLPDKRFISYSKNENTVSELLSFGYPEIYTEYDEDPNYRDMFLQEVGKEVYLSFALGDSIYKWDGQKLNPEFSLRSLNDHKFYPLGEIK